MSFEITVAFVTQFKANVIMLCQQKGSLLRGTVDEEPITGKKAMIETMGPTSLQKKKTRHGDTPLISTPHDRRQITCTPYEGADLIDNEDKVRMLNDPTSMYALNFAFAAGRTIDDVVIESATASAWTGEDGTVEVTFPASQQIAVDYEDGATKTGLTFEKVLETRRILDMNEVPEDEEFYFVHTGNQLWNLLQTMEATSEDYVAVKALIQGKIQQWMGFTWKKCNRLKISGTYARSCLAYARSGIRLGVNSNPKARISERDDKSYSVQVFFSLDVGAVRTEEEKVVEILCDETRWNS